MKVGFRRIAVLVGVLALIAASCGEDPAPPADGNGGGPADETVCARTPEPFYAVGRR